ncbi:MAG: pentapeptide repeat-containing protein [Xenococcaceae cyanobacterium]
MTSPTIKRGKQRPKTQRKKWLYILFLISRSLLSRRLSAWLLEVSLITASAVIPYSIGTYVQAHSEAETVSLNPILAGVEKTKEKIFALSSSPALPQQVPPLTNFLWSVGLVAPILLTGCQLYLLAKTGQTSPKRWLGIKVVTTAGNPPGWGKIMIREGIARYGLSGVSAYTLWFVIGAAPNGGILFFLFALILTVEKGMATQSDRYCALHDIVAGTIAIDAKKGLTTYTKTPKTPPQSEQPTIVEVQSYPYLSQSQPNPTYILGEETNSNLVLYTSTPTKNFNLWQWMRSHPGITLLSVTSAGIFSVLATVVGTQIYVQTQANQRQVNTDNNQVFLSLVNRLSATSSDPLTERKSIILSLARLDDPRTIPLLVDLLGQETNPAIVETIQQALVSIGTETLPHLKRLNQSLSQDVTALSPKTNKTIAPQAVANLITKILSIYSGKLAQVDLSQVNLAPINLENSHFTLSLPQKDLSGINFQGAILHQADFQKSKFAHLGKNERIANLSNAHLQGVDFTKAILTNVILHQSNLTGATLSQSNLTNAQLNGSNLSSVEMIGADAEAVQLLNASLTGANLGNSKFTKANLTGASLGQVKALATNFSQANLTQSNWQGANLTAANLSKANLQQADLSLTQLQKANLTNAQLQKASLVHANLSAADLRGANVDGADFQGVIFAIITPQNSKQFLAEPPKVASMAQIKGVNFTKVKNLNSSQMEFICDRGGIHPNCK